MNKDERLVPPKADGQWTRIDDYLASMARRRTARRNRTPRPRSEPESPRMLLSTLPFLALFTGFVILAIAVAIAAWPPSQPDPQPPKPAKIHELGTAPPGWYQEAQKDFHR